MTRQVVVAVVLLTVALGGCLGGPGTGPEGAEPADAGSLDVPGVTNGTLSNATALARANEARLSELGGALTVDWDTETTDATFDLVVGPGFDTYAVTGDPGSGPQAPTEVALWSNETTRFLRASEGGNVSYRAVERRSDRLNVLASVGEYLAAGDFAVSNATGPNGTVVLTATDFEQTSDRENPLADARNASARLVVGESGLIHALTVEATVGGETHAYRYRLERTGVDRVSPPDWLADVPGEVTLQPRLSVNVENESYLVVRNEGGDGVPAGTVLSLTSNGTSGQATFRTTLDAGETRYAYVENGTGDLALAATRPSADAVDPLESPVSIEITTESGVALYSGGMAWETASASSPESGSGAEDGAGAGTGSGAGGADESDSATESSGES